MPELPEVETMANDLVELADWNPEQGLGLDIRVFYSVPVFEVSCSDVRLDSALLERLSAAEDGLQSFLTKVHTSMERGMSISQLESELAKEIYWTGLKLAYREFKDFFSVNVSISGSA